MGYLNRVEHYRERYRCIVYAYVLMSNHVHLLIENGAVGLSKIMQGLQFSYTQRDIRRYRVAGHLLRSLSVYVARSGAGSKAECWQNTSIAIVED